MLSTSTMHLNCPHCEKQPDYVSDVRTIFPHGSYYRTSDSRHVKRFKCLTCKKTFSQATHDSCYRQKKRQKNRAIYELLASGVTGRRIARLLRIHRTTVARRLIFLGSWAREKLYFDTAFSRVQEMEFDDLETFEHSKCKPLSVTLAVESKTRRILGFEVAQMAAKGRLAEKSRKLYGKRRDERGRMRRKLFANLERVLSPGALIKSDSNPYYLDDVKRYFPDCHYIQVLGQRGAITGQGELKKIPFDPIFSLNHTCAMFRANVARLIRKTWATTKLKSRLEDHLAIYAVYHNQHLKA